MESDEAMLIQGSDPRGELNYKCIRWQTEQTDQIQIYHKTIMQVSPIIVPYSVLQ